MIHFLNDMLCFKEGLPIVDVRFLKAIQDPETYAHKTSIVDILCQDEKGNKYITQMQVAREKGFEKRAMYYAAKAYGSQLLKGDEFTNLKEVVFLAITDFVMFPEKEDYKSDHVILDIKTYENDLKDFSFTFTELPKFQKKAHELSSIIDRWIYFFKHADDVGPKELAHAIGDFPVIERVYRELESFWWDEDDMFNYENEDKQERVHRNLLRTSFEDGKNKGKKEGLKEGFKEGTTLTQEAIVRELLACQVERKVILKSSGWDEKRLDLFISTGISK